MRNENVAVDKSYVRTSIENVAVDKSYVRTTIENVTVEQVVRYNEISKRNI